MGGRQEGWQRQRPLPRKIAASTDSRGGYIVTSHDLAWLHHGQSNLEARMPLAFFGGGFRLDALQEEGRWCSGKEEWSDEPVGGACNPGSRESRTPHNRTSNPGDLQLLEKTHTEAKKGTGNVQGTGWERENTPLEGSGAWDRYECTMRSNGAEGRAGESGWRIK
jgi:hypothetical protein